VVARLRARGVKGVGQSSWGPTVFAVTQQSEAEALAKEMAPATVADSSGGVVVESL